MSSRLLEVLTEESCCYPGEDRGAAGDYGAARMWTGAEVKAPTPDGASLVEEDNEEGEQFDFDDSDDSDHHQAAEGSDWITRNQPGSEVREATKPVGPAGRRPTGRPSLYHQCSNNAGSEVRESPEGCSVSSDLTTIGEADCSWKANCLYEGRAPVQPDALQEELARAAVEAPALQEARQLHLQEASSWTPPAGDHVTTVSCIPDKQEEAGDAEVLYDDVPAEAERRGLDSDPTKDTEDIYEDIQPVVEQHSNGWSSNEFESFDDLSDEDAATAAAAPAAPAFRIRQLTNNVLKLKDSRLVGGKLAATSRPIPQSRDSKVQQLIKAARTGTRDGLERTKTAMMRRVSFLQRKASTVEEQDDAGYMDVSVSESKHPPPQLCPMPEGLSSQQVVRRLILSSIVQSEISYLDSLKRILWEYQEPLLEQSSVLSHRKVRQIFYRVQEIHQCHTMFRIALSSRVSEWDRIEIIGDLFVASFSKSMVLNVYSDYINNFTNAMALIKKACLSKPLFLDFLKRKQASSADRITLYGLMVKPIQRFPQFILLLQDMLKNTPRSHADRLPLQLALTELETLAVKLNQQKHLADQEVEIQLISQSAGGGRSLHKLLNTEQRHLIHCETLIETVYGDKGQVFKSKERKLFLLNDWLICANVNLKGPSDVNSLVPLGPKYTVKWCHPLVQTEVVEAGQEAADSINSVTTTARGNMLLGPPGLYQELEELQHDLDVVKHVSHMVGTLQGTYQNLNSTVSQDWCLALQRLVRLKEEEIQNANKCRLSLSVPGRPDRSGHPVNIMVVFNTPSPLSKISWVNWLHLAKIAQRPENIMGWKCAEEEDEEKNAPFRSPLLTCKLPVLASRGRTLKLAAALHSPPQSSPIGFCTASTSLPQGYLWVAGGGDDPHQGQVEIFSLHRSTPHLVKTVSVNAPVVCLEYVRGACVRTQQPGAERFPPAAQTGNILCVGLQDGSVLVYSSLDTAVQCLLTFVTPGGCPVTSLKHNQGFLFAGLANGSVAVYQREAGDGLWDVDSCTLVALGSNPVADMLILEDTVWASCANEVTVFQESSLRQSFTAHSDPSCAVSHMVQSGVGVWMAFSCGSSMHLFHTETLEQLQELNISPRTSSLATGQLLVSSLLICKDQLWVGTNEGLVLCFPVPTPEGIPKVTGKGKTSLNAHCGPVDFLLSVSGTLALNLLKEDLTLSGCSDPGDDVDVAEGHRKFKQGSQDSEGCALPQEKPVHLLQYRLCSTHHLPGKRLTAQPEHESSDPAPPAGFLEHSLEDGSIYEVSEDPDVWVRGQAATCRREGEGRRSKVVSTAVFSGGPGHRRVGESAPQREHNSGDNTLLVWQLPLTFSP